jgi:hypothetical protein
LKSFQPKQDKPMPPPDDPGNPTVDFRGELAVERNARFEDRPRRVAGAQKRGERVQVELQREPVGGESQRLIVDAEVFVANGTAERDAALIMLEKIPGTRPVTVGGDKGFDTHGRTTRHPGIWYQPEKKETNRGMLRLVENDRMSRTTVTGH